MASKTKIIEMVASVKTIYAYYAKDTDTATLINTWCVLLKDYPDSIVETAFYKCLQNCKMPPTPADAIEQINKIHNASLPSAESLWVKYVKALNKVEDETYKFRFTMIEDNGKSQGENARLNVQKIFDNLPDEIQKYVGSFGELIRMANYTEQDLRFEKNRFLKSMPEIAKQNEYLKLSNQKLIEE